MNKYINIIAIKALYERGENVIQHLRANGLSNTNSVDDILISYDLQSGSYIKGYYKDIEYKNNYCQALATRLNTLGTFDSIIEIGIGEATTLGVLISKLDSKPANILGFDISLSRVLFAKNFLQEIQIPDVALFTANLFDIPLADNSIEVVYTSHSIEPNGGKEKEALSELYRIAKKYVVLLEPAYELASPEGKARMDQHGYVKNLAGISKDLGYNVIEHRLFDYSTNALNPTGIIIIEKNSNQKNNPDLVCPITKTTLTKYNDNLLFSEQSYLAYPVVNDIPCLLPENAILAFHLKTDYDRFKSENNI